MPDAPLPSAIQLEHLINATRAQVNATLAAALIANSGRPHSIQEMLDLLRDIQFARNPEPGSGAYQEWAKTKDQRLKERHT